MNDQLTTMLREAASRETMSPAPPALVRHHAERVRNRRRAGAALAGVSAAAAVALAFQGSLSGITWSWNAAPASGNTTSPAPSEPAPSASAPSPAPSASASGTPTATDDTSGGPVNTTEPWPAPPTARADKPWTRPGFDAGHVVAARMEDGHAVITVDRTQLYSAEQWEAMTGEKIDMDFKSLNESTRTRQFVVDDDALIYLNVQYGVKTAPFKVSPEEFVRRTGDKLLEQANLDKLYPPGPGETVYPPSIGIVLFHRDRLDGPVAYIEDSGVYTG